MHIQPRTKLGARDPAASRSKSFLDRERATNGGLAEAGSYASLAEASR